MKYIMIEKNGERFPILFPNDLVHSEVTSSEGKVVSAGFCHITDDDVQVSDESSVSLGIGPAFGDEVVISLRMIKGLTSLDIANPLMLKELSADKLGK